jgi:hypothetical protein
LAAQSVRISLSESGMDQSGAAGEGFVRRAVVFGVRDHASVTDTDMQARDRFIYQDREWEIFEVIEVPGEIQARAEARQQ